IEKYILNVYPKVYKQVKRHKAGQSQPLKDIGRDFYDSDKRENSGNFQEEADEKETDLLDKPDERDTALLTDDEKETGLLGDEEDTQLLESYEPNYPYIIRLNTDEKIYIDKPVFRIGKEKSYVDYFIASNNAISRIHADIITKDNKFFVKDNNSTNHTFVNGSMITQRQIAEIYDGDSLMFANEPFEFHISQ
ncbi:MAG: FHA domain-containing protein, partial [Clostridiales bacterium]|nr:FHA domain-containing protein [Clostridiales bacterium]